MTRYTIAAISVSVPAPDAPWRECPSDPDGEAGVLGSVLADPACLPRVAGIVRGGEAFADPRHREAYRALTRLGPGDRSPEALRAELHAIAGARYAEDLAACVPSAANAVWYGLRMRAAYRRREIIRAAALATREAYDGSVAAARAAMTGGVEDT